MQELPARLEAGAGVKPTPARMADLWMLLEHVSRGAHLEIFGPGSATPNRPCVGRIQSGTEPTFYASCESATVEDLIPMLLKRWECVLQGNAEALIVLMQEQAREELDRHRARQRGH